MSIQPILGADGCSERDPVASSSSSGVLPTPIFELCLHFDFNSTPVKFCCILYDYDDSVAKKSLHRKTEISKKTPDDVLKTASVVVIAPIYIRSPFNAP